MTGPSGPTLVDAGDDAFVTVIATDLPRLRQLARVLADADADDLVADMLTRTWPKWRAGRIDDLGVYQRRVLVRLASRRWRRRRLGRERDRAALGWATASGDALEELAERDRTQRAVRRLPPRRRAIVALRYDDDLTEARIAEVLGIAVGTVKSQLSKALVQLRIELEERDDE